MKNKNIKHLIYIFLFIIAISCSKKEETQTAQNITPDETAQSESVTFTAEQIELAGIKTGKIENKTISDEYVENGSVLATLQHPDFIQLQQQYIEAKSQVDYYKEEFKRQGELTVENAASMKNMQKAKADFYTYEANYKSLKSQLELLGVNTQEIEKGDFVKEFKVLAPISGYISKISGNTGKYVNPDICLYEIIDDSNLTLHLNVFEKDLIKVKEGQKVIFRLLNDPKDFETKVKMVGIKIDETNRSSMVHSLIENKNKLLKPGMHVTADIYISNRNTYAVPTESIVDINKESYIFIRENNQFKKVTVIKGIEQDSFCEIIDPSKDLLNAEIVVKGTYFLMSALLTED